MSWNPFKYWPKAERRLAYAMLLGLCAFLYFSTMR